MFRPRLALLTLTIAFASALPGTAAETAPVGQWRTVDAASGLPSDKVFAVVVDGPRAWAGTDAGLARVDRRTLRVEQVLGETEGLPFRVVTALALDPSTGDVWIGTMGGLARLSAGRIDAFTQLDSGLANNVIYGVALDEGYAEGNAEGNAQGNDAGRDGRAVWVATAAGLSRYAIRSKTWEIFDTTNTLMHEPWCYAVTADAGVVYVAVWGSGVVVRDGRDGRFRIHRDPDGEMEIDLFRDDGLVHDVTSAIAVDGNIMWVGTYFGLSRYDGRRWQSFSADDSGLAGDFINFVKARDGAVWVGTDQGLSRFDSATWHTWQETPGGKELRITGADGRARTVRSAAGPPTNVIYGIDVTRDELWLATAAGLTRGTLSPEPAAAATSAGDE